jgi:small subunit ribosomal protein S1
MSNEVEALAVAPVTPPNGEGPGMAEEDFEEMYRQSLRYFREGEVVRGKVVKVQPDFVLVDIGYKSEGAIPKEEFTNPAELAEGAEFDVYIERPEDEHGMPVLSKIKAEKVRNWSHIQRAYDEERPVEGRIVRRVKGGLKVDIGVDAFMPASQLTWRPTSDLDRYLGQTMQVKIIKLTKRRRNVVVSRRKVIEEQRAGEKSRLLATIKVGQIIKGEVKNITDFGAFVDVGGIDGLLHVTDMSWGRVKHPSQAASVGQQIEVMVLNFDPKTERISLGLKQKSENPWKSAVERYTVGSVVRGRVVSMTDYGAFVQLETGIEGMVHVSEMSWTRRVRHPSEVVQPDQILDVMVLSVDAEAEKIALGIKQTLPNPWRELESRYPVGSVVKGLVRNLTDYGAFVEIEPGIDALLHVSDLSWTRKVAHPSETVQKGQEIQVKILSIDVGNEKIGVGLKQIEADPWQALAAKLVIGAHVEVEIVKVVSFGAFARLEDGIEGLIHISELARDRVQKPEEAVSVGERKMSKVVSIEPTERKIGLSIREYERDMEAQAQDEHAQRAPSGTVSIGDVIGDAVPKSLFESGRSLAEVADELMSQLSSKTAESAEAKLEEGPAAPSAEPSPDSVPENLNQE